MRVESIIHMIHSETHKDVDDIVFGTEKRASILVHNSQSWKNALVSVENVLDCTV